MRMVATPMASRSTSRLAELLADSESELAFIIGHELGHVYQFRTGEQFYHPDNAELDADVWGLWLSLLSGYDPYAGAGTLAKMEMLKPDAPTLDSQQYLQQITSVHGSFNERLDLHLRHHSLYLQGAAGCLQFLPQVLPSPLP